MLSSFPDYGKASPSYLVGIVEFMTTLSPKETALVTDKRRGIPARCKFLPTVADFMEIINDYEASQAKYAHIRDYSGLRPMTEAENAAAKMQQIPRVHDKYGNWLAPSDAAERLKDHEIMVETMKRAHRLKAWILQLGDGDAIKGWERAIEMDQAEPPEDFQP